MKIKRAIGFLVIVLLLTLVAYYYPYFTGRAIDGSKKTDNAKEHAFVKRVVDGDTIDTDVGKIRLLGINTPEKGKYYYNEAKNFLITIENKSVELEKDSEDIDKYGRKLRYVFFNDRIINVEIVQLGWASTFMLDGLKYKDKFISAEKFARENGVGLWAKSFDKCSNCIKLVRIEAFEDFFVIKNECYFNCNLTGWEVKDDANHFFKLSNLNSGEEKRYNTKEYTGLEEVWNDGGDRFFMRDDSGKLVIFYGYSS